MPRLRDEMEPDLLPDPSGRRRRAREKSQPQPQRPQPQDHAQLPSSSNTPPSQAHGQSQPAHVQPRDRYQPQQAHLQPHGERGPHQVEPQQDATRPYRFYPIKAHSSRRTSPFAWCTAIVCAIIWTVVIIGGLVVLIGYLIFRPKSPRFEIASVTLNGAYLDAGDMLNADLTILANFTNPNRRVDVTFRYVAVDLYFKGTLVATQGVDRFSERAGESTLRAIHMVSSQVALTRAGAEEWSKEAGGPGGVKMEVRGGFVTTSDFVGTFLRFTYVLHGHCDIAVGGPPSGVLLSSNCTTRR